MISIRTAEARHRHPSGRAKLWRTFDPRADSFAALAALDENLLPPLANVPRTPREEAEIVTYVREGTLLCRDARQHAGLIHAGEFQRMVARLGSRHSEANASRVHRAQVFQVRLRRLPVERELGREQKRFSAADRRGGLCVVASPDARSGSLRLDQDAAMYSALLEPGQHVVHELAPGRAAWLHVVQGDIALCDLVLTTGDGAGVTTERSVSLTARADSEILLLDIVGPSAAHDLQTRPA